MSTVKISSKVPYPLTVSYDAGGSKKSTTRSTVTLFTGRNQVDKEKWEAIKDTQAVKSRRDAGDIAVGIDLSKNDITNLMGLPSRGFIKRLCAKASPIPTGQKEDGDFYTLEEQRKRGIL